MSGSIEPESISSTEVSTLHKEESVAPRRIQDRSHTVQFLGRFRSNTSAIVGLSTFLVLAVLAIGAPLFTKYDPTDVDTTVMLQTSSRDHFFGTDDLGRDLFSRVLYGTRVSVLVGLVISGVTTITGSVCGLLSGYYPKLDGLIMRFMDIIMGFPTILLALVIVAILGTQLINVVIALGIAYTPGIARIIRGCVLQLKQEEFVMAARAVGARDSRIIFRHILPNSLAPLIVQETYILALSVLSEAYLTFIGVGVPPTVPTLGSIIADSRVHLQHAPWLPLYPGLAISLLVLSVNLLGDGLRDTLDPRMKK